MKNEVVKQTYLFSCFCGLRISDIIGLKWKNVYIDNGQYRLEVVMQKTKEPIYLPLSEEALKWMPEREEKTAEDRVFDLPSPTYINVILKPWAKVADIDKHFNFSHGEAHVRHDDADARSGLIYDFKIARSRRCKDDASLCENRKPKEGRGGQSCERIIQLEPRKNGLKKSLVYEDGHI